MTTTTQQEKFAAAQAEMKKLCNIVPKQFQKWDFVRVQSFKKTVKACEPFLKLNPTNDQAKYIKLENQLTTLRKFHQ